MAEDILTTVKSTNGDRTTPPPQKPWFCVSQLVSGTIVRSEADSVAAVLQNLQDSTLAWVDHVTSDFRAEAIERAVEIGFDREMATTLVTDARVNYVDQDAEMGFRVPSIQVAQFEVTDYPLLFFIRANLVLTIHPQNVDRRFMRLRRYAETFIKKIPLDLPLPDRITMLVMRLIDHNNDRNFEHLRQIDERGDALHQSMMDATIPREKLGAQIYQMKHALIAYLNGLWDTVDVLHALRYGDAELITDDRGLLDKLGVLGEDVNQQIGLAEHMSEVLASGLEVLQSIYNNQLQALNNRLALLMTYLTIVGTAVLVPNTLATMLGNSVFDIGPEDLWWYLLLMVGSTVSATFLVYWWIKRKGWLPKKPD